MKNVTKFLFLFAVLSLVLASCSKEKKLEQQLTRKDGKWNAKSVNYKYYVGSSVEEAGNYPATGAIEFKKGGSFFLNISFGAGAYLTSSGTWTNTKDQITIVADGQASVLKVISGPKKGKLVLEETYADPASNEKETFTYNLERAD
ncbi:hypothetical protein D3C87_285160 [compost metagenome]